MSATKNKLLYKDAANVSKHGQLREQIVRFLPRCMECKRDLALRILTVRL